MNTSYVISWKRLAVDFACVVMCGALFLPADAMAALPVVTFTSDLTPTATAMPGPSTIELTEQDDGSLAKLGEDQVLAISLESNPSTGYSWQVAEIDARVLHQVGTAQFRQMSPLLGAPGRQILRFRRVGAGRSTLKLVYRRPW